MAFTDALFNTLVLILWFRLWNRDDRDAFFNPYISSIKKVADTSIGFVRPMFFGMSDTGVALVLIAALMLIKALAVYARAPFLVGSSVGLGFWSVPYARLPHSMGYAAGAAALSFAIYLFKLWSLSIVFVRSASSSYLDRAQTTLHRLGMPFTRASLAFQPLLLLLFGMVISGGTFLLGGIPAEELNVAGLAMRMFVCALAGWVQILPLISSLIVLFIIGSWISLFTGSSGLAYTSNEWLNVVLGPLRRYPIRLGMFDITPIIAIFALSWISAILLEILGHSYDLIP